MNVFEDLIVELKEENLLEETVFTAGYGNRHDEFSMDFEMDPGEDDILADSTVDSHDERESEEAAPVAPRSSTAVGSKQKTSAEQVSAFQMVEHILGAVESSRLNVEPKTYDELAAKKALHRYVQAAADPSSMEYAEAETVLAGELSTWQKSLERRDKEISSSVMRHYCETCQPALSPQALFALARFYRSIPFSESSRSKFEFIATRLFSRSDEDGQKQLICTKEEMLGHLKSRFKTWNGDTQNLRNDDDDEKILAVLTFDDFAAEAENAGNFEELIGSDFFKRMHQFKESCVSLFFAPTVTAAAIACNVKIGNRLVELINDEKGDNNAGQIRERFSILNDELISDAAGRTLNFKGSSKEAPVTERRSVSRAESRIDSELTTTRQAERAFEADKTSGKSGLQFKIAGVNKWLLTATIVAVTLSVGLYVWANYYADETPVKSAVKVADLENSPLKEFVKEGRISTDTFYGITLPVWDTLSKENKEEVLQKALRAGTEKGYKRVSLMNAKGQTVGFASATRLEVLNP